MEPQSEKTSFLGFVPAMVIQHLQDTIGKGKQFPLPQKQSVNSVVMFADISGFTNLTEKLSSQGTEGCEKIAFAINRYMELMVKEIGKSGGDIFKFAGDAMIIVWPPPEKTENAEVWLRDSTRKALQAALAIQQRLDATKIMDDIRLSVKIGFGVGKFSIVYVGGVFGRAEYLPAGDPLNQAFEAESYAPHGGVVIVSPQVYQIVSEFFEFTMCEKKKDDPNPKIFPFYRVQSVKQKIRSVADAVLINDRITAKDIEKIKSNVLSYVPKALQQYIQYEQERWSSELRKLSIMFMNIGIDLAHADSEEGLKKLQKVIQTVQKCVYIHEGSLNKFLMDDKGSTLIVVFGLPPMTHQDDAQRACLCGFLLQQELQKLDTKCSIGVATGLVFAGVVGTSGNRREYSVIGDSVNLAARIMGDAKGQKDIQKKFLCCETTYLKCQNQISFQFFAKRQFKGKSIKLNIYQPLNLTNEQFREINKMNLFPNLRTHKFSFPIKDAEDIKKQDLKDFQFMHGRQDIFRDACQHLDTFIKSKFKSCFTLIRGTFGIGKSLFLRKILINCYEKKEHYQKLSSQNKQFFVISVSTLNSFTRKQKLNGFRSILQHLFQKFSKKNKRPADESLLKFMIPLYEINQNSFDPKIKEIQQLMRHVFGIEFYDYVQNFPAPQKPYNEEAIKAEKKMIAKYIKQFFATYLQMQPKKKDNNNESATMSDNSSQYEAQINQKQLLDTPPLILVLDDLQQNDIYSFKIIRMLLKNFYRIYIFGAMRDEFIEKPVLQQPDYPNQEQICIDEVQKTGEILKEHGQEGRYKIIDLKSLKLDEIKTYIFKVFQVNEIQYQDKQLQKQCLEGNQINDLQQQENEFQKSYSYLFFSKIKKELMKKPAQFFLNFLYLKVGGNPNKAYDFIQSLLNQKLILIPHLEEQIQAEKDEDPLQRQNTGKKLIEQKRINSVMYITNYLKKIIELEDLLTSDVPFMCYQINGPIIDKQNILDILVLKVASLIGDVFDLQMLYKVYPFKDIIKAEQLKQILFNLERIHFLEILDQNEYNIYFRFQDSFIRECIYQRLTYQQRRQLHLQVAEAIQTLPQYDDDENAEGDRLVYHWCLGENKKDITNQDQFSHKAKRSIIVKKITTILGKHDKTDKDFLLKSEVLQKKSDSNVTWADRFTVLSSKDLKYYRDETYYRAKPQEPLGYIPLRNIFQINALNENAIGGKQFAFKIQTSGWIKKDKLMESRTFYFAAISDMQLEEWSIYLEFARAKAIYDDFVGKFGKISFPIGTQFNIDPIFRQILQANKKQNYEKEQVQTKIQPQGLSRRTSRAFNSKSFLQSLKVKQITNDQQLDKEEDLQTLKNQLQEFMQKGMLMFFAHVFEMSLQKEDEYKKFGEMTKFQKKYPDFFRQKSNVSTLQSPYKKGQVEIKSPNFQDQITQFRQNLMAKNNKQSYDESEGQQQIDMENFLLNQGIGNNIQKNKIQKPVNRRSLEPTSLNIPKFDEFKRKQTNLTQQSHQSDTQSSMLHQSELSNQQTLNNYNINNNHNSIKQNEQIIETNRENKLNDFQSVSEDSQNQGEEVKKNKNIENLQEEQNKQKEENEQTYEQDKQKLQNQIQIQNNDQKNNIGIRENTDTNENNLTIQNNSINNQPKQRKSSSFIQKEILEDAMTFSQFNNRLPQKKKSLNLETFPQIPNQNKTNNDSNETSQFQIQTQNKNQNMNQSGQNNNFCNNNNNNQNQDFQNSSTDIQTKLQQSQYQQQQITEQQQQTSDNLECNQQKFDFSSMQIQEEQQYFLGDYDENIHENQQVTKQPLAEIMEESDYTNTNTVTNSNSVYFQNQNPDQNNYRKSAILQSQIQNQNNNNINIIGTNNNNIHEIVNQQAQFNKNQNNFDIDSGQNNNSNLNFQNKELISKMTGNQNQEFQQVQNNNLSGSQIKRHEFIQQIKQTQPFSNNQVRKNSQIQQQQYQQSYQQQKQQPENQQFQFANNINNQSESRSSLTSSPIKIEKNINQNKRHSYEISEKEKFSSHKSSISYIQKTQKKSLKLSEVDKNDYFDNFIGSQNLGIERQDSHLFKGRTSVDRQIAEQLIQQEEQPEDLLQDYKFQPEKGKIQSELFKSVVFKSRPSLIFETEAQIYHKLKPPKNNSQHQQQQFNIKSQQIFQPYEGSLFTSSLSNIQTSQLTKNQMQKIQQIQQQQLQQLLISTQIQQSQISSTQQQQAKNQGQNNQINLQQQILQQQKLQKYANQALQEPDKMNSQQKQQQKNNSQNSQNLNQHFYLQMQNIQQVNSVLMNSQEKSQNSIQYNNQLKQQSIQNKTPVKKSQSNLQSFPNYRQNIMENSNGNLNNISTKYKSNNDNDLNNQKNNNNNKDKKINLIDVQQDQVINQSQIKSYPRNSKNNSQNNSQLINNSNQNYSQYQQSQSQSQSLHENQISFPKIDSLQNFSQNNSEKKNSQ